MKAARQYRPQEEKPAGKSRSRRIARRTFLAVCGGGAVAGVLGYHHLSVERPDLPLSMGRLPPDADSPITMNPDCLKGFEDLGIRHLSEFDRLPWFEKTDTGLFRLREDAGLGPIVDTHAHVGWAFGLGRSVDMSRRGKVGYVYDFEQEQDVLFTQIHPTNEEATQMSHEVIGQFLKTPARSRTRTVANLAAEMDLMNYANVALLPIAIPHQTRHVRDTLAAVKMDARLLPFGAIHPKPWGPKKVAELERQVKEHGIKALKYHPVFQLVAPDDPDMMKLFEWCEAHEMLVYAHTGYTGKEPDSMRARSEPQRFIKPLEAFPKLRIVFAHTGIRRVDEALETARRFEDRVWLDISGQAVPAIAYILERYDTEKVLFGSDWPFYPLAVMVARCLVATESCPHLREPLFSANAKRLFALTNK